MDLSKSIFYYHIGSFQKPSDFPESIEVCILKSEYLFMCLLTCRLTSRKMIASNTSILVVFPLLMEKHLENIRSFPYSTVSTSMILSFFLVIILREKLLNSEMPRLTRTGKVIFESCQPPVFLVTPPIPAFPVQSFPSLSHLPLIFVEAFILHH